MANTTRTAKGIRPTTGVASVPTHPFESLPGAEKERIWASFNQPTPFEETRPLTPAQRAQWRRVKRKMGRPKVGKGAKVISLSVERGLLKEADAFAKRHKLSRAKLFALGLEAVLGHNPSPRL